MTSRLTGASDSHKPKLGDQMRTILQATRLPPQAKLFFPVADHFTAHCASINAGEVLSHRRSQQ
jgi:hypothetical protein